MKGNNNFQIGDIVHRGEDAPEETITDIYYETTPIYQTQFGDYYESELILVRKASK